MHNLLARQIKKFFGGEEKIPGEAKAFVAAVNDAYQQADVDRLMLERSMELSSREMLQAEEELRNIMDAVPAWIFYKDSENRFVRVNKTFADAMGMSKEQLEKKSLFDLFPKEQAEAFWRDDKAVIASQNPRINIIEPVDLPKGERWVQTDKMPYHDALGNAGIIGFALDITERRQAEDQLKEKLADLEEFHDLTVGRELKMMELEKEIERLKKSQ
jgi:PAS domain S-box-containing protein